MFARTRPVSARTRGETALEPNYVEIPGCAGAGTAGATPPHMPFVPVVIAALAVGIFVATLRLGRAA